MADMKLVIPYGNRRYINEVIIDFSEVEMVRIMLRNSKWHANPLEPEVEFTLTDYAYGWIEKNNPELLV